MSDAKNRDEQSKKRESSAENPVEVPVRRRSVIREYFEALLIAGIFLGFSNTFLVKTFYIPSGSMKQTLLIGDHLFVNRFIYGPAAGPLADLLPAREPERGDIVIFRSVQTPQTDLVKRLIGLPGDRIEVVDKVLYVNGQQVDDSSYTQHVDPRVFPDRPFVKADARRRDNFGPYEVPEDHYFFLGDNRDESYDSRFWGAVPRHYVKGRAWMIYWSNGGPTPDGEWPGWKERLAQISQTAIGFFSNTRWGRTFQVVR
ncbi:MAG: signal peptidase I [Thermoanaerobaculia bacterium]|nr:signal peptidase I [Thermoanaerobaculia bacterium]